MEPVGQLNVNLSCCLYYPLSLQHFEDGKAWVMGEILGLELQSCSLVANWKPVYL